MTLGRYKPRILLLTTPSYTFNARFSPLGCPKREGYPDPTRRTDRVFRHDDHKFEWTPEEFQAWCEDVASLWGYTVDVGAVGLPNEPDPWGRDADLGRASQTAIFRRIEDTHAPAPLTENPSPDGETTSHKLLAMYNHEAHPAAGFPSPNSVIQSEILRVMEEYYPTGGWSVWELWVCDAISSACGGRIDVLAYAIETCADLRVEVLGGEPANRWTVRFADEERHSAVTPELKRHASQETVANAARVQTDWRWPQYNGSPKPSSQIEDGYGGWGSASIGDGQNGGDDWPRDGIVGWDN